MFFNNWFGRYNTCTETGLVEALNWSGQDWAQIFPGDNNIVSPKSTQGIRTNKDFISHIEVQI